MLLAKLALCAAANNDLPVLHSNTRTLVGVIVYSHLQVTTWLLETRLKYLHVLLELMHFLARVTLQSAHQHARLVLLDISVVTQQLYRNLVLRALTNHQQVKVHV